MWLSDKWNDYAVLDASDGEKLERWGDYILVRPDPQVIWKTKRTLHEWKKANGVYHRSSSGGGSWTFRDLPEVWSVSYGDLTFRLKPMNFKHTGLFPEQAVNWDWIRARIREANRPVKILNLFAYTGAATIACAKEGASVVHVDSAKGMVAWAKENAAASGLQDAHIRYLVDDCVKFTEREIRRGNTYDGIVMDPPSYGRGPSGELWKLEENLYPFLLTVSKLLSDNPLFMLVNSYTTGLQPLTIANLMQLACRDVMQQKSTVEAAEIGLPVRSGIILPCGASGRMVF